MAEIRRILIAYDVPDDRRRTRLASALSKYGDRVQYSVFVADLAPVRLARIQRDVEGIIDVHADSVLLCDLGPTEGVEARRFKYIGRQRPVTSAESFVI